LVLKSKKEPKTGFVVGCGRRFFVLGLVCCGYYVKAMLRDFLSCSTVIDIKLSNSRVQLSVFYGKIMATFLSFMMRTW
jgi:hypothetical protein